MRRDLLRNSTVSVNEHEMGLKTNVLRLTALALVALVFELGLVSAYARCIERLRPLGHRSAAITSPSGADGATTIQSLGCHRYLKAPAFVRVRKEPGKSPAPDRIRFGNSTSHESLNGFSLQEHTLAFFSRAPVLKRHPYQLNCVYQI
jgi:hypothetical protein